VTVLDRCLRKDPRQRLRDIGDVRLMLDSVLETGVTPAAASASAAVMGRPAMFTIAAAAVALVVGTVFVVRSVTRPPSLPVVRLTASHPGEEDVGAGGAGTDVVMTPDGHKLVYLAGPPGQKQIYVRTLDQLAVTRLEASGVILAVFLSPDGQWVGFTDGRERSLKKIPIAGGAVVTICDSLTTTPLSPTWGENDRIVFTQNQPLAFRGLWSVSAAGGRPERLLSQDDRNPETFYSPVFLPGGRALLFGSAPPDQGDQVDSYRTEVLDLATGARTELLRGGSHARYVSSGHLLFANGGSLHAVRFDLDRLRVTGTAVRLIDGVFVRAKASRASAPPPRGRWRTSGVARRRPDGPLSGSTDRDARRIPG
jgi:serine/threonine-protein kinase